MSDTIKCFGIRVDMTRCQNAATRTVRSAGFAGGEDDTYPACDDCSSLVDGCDGVTIEPLEG